MLHRLACRPVWLYRKPIIRCASTSFGRRRMMSRKSFSAWSGRPAPNAGDRLHQLCVHAGTPDCSVAGPASPSPRLPSGRLRPSEPAVGPPKAGPDGRAMESVGVRGPPQAQFATSEPVERPLTRIAQNAQSDLSPQAGRGEEIRPRQFIGTRPTASATEIAADRRRFPPERRATTPATGPRHPPSMRPKRAVQLSRLTGTHWATGVPFGSTPLKAVSRQ